MRYWSRCIAAFATNRQLTILGALCLMACTASCTRQPTAPAETQLPLEGVSLKLLIVDDEPLAQAIALLRGQWQAETGSELSVETVTEKDLAALTAGGLSEVDAANRMRHACWEHSSNQRQSPRSARCESLDDRQLDWADIFELL